jgi:hypothetical protein
VLRSILDVEMVWEDCDVEVSFMIGYKKAFACGSRLAVLWS